MITLLWLPKRKVTILAPSYNFQKLTPLNDCKLGAYDEALDFAFANDDLRNIAITGPHSSGKSSIFNSYLAHHKNIKKLYISLAHFKSMGTQNEPSEAQKFNPNIENNIANYLAGKVLNQLAHQLDPKRIPFSDFKILRQAKHFTVCMTTIFMILFFILFGMVLFADTISEIASKWPESFGLKYFLVDLTDYRIFPWLLLAFISLIGIGCRKLVILQLNGKLIKSFSFKGNTINLFEDKEASFFDKHLDEVLYILNNADVEVIIFEDIDRYDNNLVFTKLREINYLANQKTGKTIRFFYLIKDDMFDFKDRTKFFDFIIPIVPIIDGSNSYEQLQKILKAGGLPKEPNEYFLKDLSLYVDDMRILKNIYNEFRVYLAQIASTEQDITKMMAMITYKNIFPNDFSNLHLRNGYVFFMFKNRKASFVQDVKGTLEQKIIEKKNQLIEYDNEHLGSLDELESIYIGPSIFQQSIQVQEGETKVLKTINNYESTLDFYIDFKQNLLINHQNIQNLFKQKLDKLSKNTTFIKRKTILEQKLKGFSHLRGEIEDLQKRIAYIETRSFSELASKEDHDNKLFNMDLESNEAKDFKKLLTDPFFPLIKFLLLNGYIDESYPDYMNYFYPYSLSENDQIFLRSITERTEKPFSYSLNNSGLVLTYLEDYKFEQPQILNFNLLTYLLESNLRQIELFINNLTTHKRYDFIWAFIEHSKVEIRDTFIHKLNTQWPSIIRDWLSPERYLENKGSFQIKDYIILTCYSTSISDICKMNIEQCMTNFISGEPNFLAAEKQNIDKFISMLNALEVKFLVLNFMTINPELFEQIYKNNLYRITPTMLTLLLGNFYKFSFSDFYITKNYSLISSQPEQPLKAYVDTNIEEYFSAILGNIGGNKFNDDVDIVINILNNERLSKEAKLKYIQHLTTVLPNLKDIHDSLWESLIQNEKISFSPDNFLLYYFDFAGDYDKISIDFINKAHLEFGFNKDKILDYCDAETLDNFYYNTVKCQGLDDDKYALLIENIDTNYGDLHTSFQSIEFAGSKILVLIEKTIISMTLENLLFMRDKHSDCLQNFVEYNIADYIEIIEMNPTAKIQSELVAVLSWNIEDKNRKKIIALTDESINLKRYSFSDDILEYILESKFNLQYIDYAVGQYDNASRNLKRTIEDICQKNINHIIEADYDLSYDLLKMLLKLNSLDNATKNKLFTNQLKLLNTKKFNQLQFLELIADLDTPELKELFSNEKPKIKVTDSNTTILTFCRDAGWLNFQIDKGDEQYYRLSQRKNTGKQNMID